MSPATGAIFFAAGTGTLLLLLSSRSRYRKLLGNWISILAILIELVSIVFILSYIRGTPFMYGSASIPMAATTSIAFLFLGTALLAAVYPESFPVRLIRGNSTSARLIRWFLPLILVAILALAIISTSLLTGSTSIQLTSYSALVIGVITVTLVLGIRLAMLFGNDLDRKNKELLESEKRFEQIIDSVGDAIYIIDSASRRIVNTNKQSSLMLGYTS